VALSEKVERENAGFVHLVAAQRHPSFTACCWAHAEAGTRAVSWPSRPETARPEPVAALLSAGHETAALEAAARVLERDPRSPVIAWLAAVWGPDIDGLLVRIVPNLRTSEAVRALAATSQAYPRASALLEVVGRGLSR
jgi:folylpolyglutamate synthase/dihydropteroate synthase